MSRRVQDLLFAFILLAMTFLLTMDRFVAETDVSRFLTGLITGLLVAACVIYVVVISSQSQVKQ
ncbi:MAG: hypothetical protein IT320_19930 [Anaerolineae bacterium]|nr:hypothetical protein [Anaerolineae bacterium]